MTKRENYGSVPGQDGLFIYNFNANELKNVNPIPGCKNCKKEF